MAGSSPPDTAAPRGRREVREAAIEEATSRAREAVEASVKQAAALEEEKAAKSASTAKRIAARGARAGGGVAVGAGAAGGGGAVWDGGRGANGRGPDGPRPDIEAGPEETPEEQLERLQAEALSAPAAVGASGLNLHFGFAFWLAMAWVGLVVFAAIFAGVLPLDPPNKPFAGPLDIAPTWSHLFGTDQLGHDIFSQVVFGARVSMIVGGTSVVVGLLIGGGMGVIAGFYQGKIDVVVVWITDVLLTLPGLILALTLVAFLGESLTNVVIAIDLLSIPAYARIARAGSLAVSQRDFVLSALSLGAKPRRILFRDVIPLVAIPISSFAAIGASIAILAEGGLAFLGLASPNELSWGAMIANGQNEQQLAPQLTFAPMIAFFLTVLALNYIGQKSGSALDPRQARI